MHERCEKIFTSQTRNGGCISFIVAILLTPVTIKTKWHYQSYIGIDTSSSHSFHLGFPLFFHFLFIILLSIPLHRHRYSSLWVCLFVIAIDISVFWLLFRLLFIHLPIPKNTFARQMPSKRAKKSLKNLFLMRYSEFCLQSGCLIRGVHWQRNKERKVGT